MNHFSSFPQRSKSVLATVLVAAAFSFCANEAFAAPSVDECQDQNHFSGWADYYADIFHGKKTASGQLHDKTKLTAAHRTLPFGTRVKLVNRRNHSSCIVVINDRGPFTPNRIIDVSKEAAHALGLFSGKRMVDCYVIHEAAESKGHVLKIASARKD